MLAEKKGNWRAYVYILIGTAVMAVSITSIYDHMQMVTGGFSGLAIIIKSLTENLMPGGIPLWLTNAVLNIPLFFLGVSIKDGDLPRSLSSVPLPCRSGSFSYRSFPSYRTICCWQPCSAV